VLALACLVLLHGAACHAAAEPATGRVLSSDAVAELARRWAAEQFPTELDGAVVELAAPPRELPLPPGEMSTRLSLQSGSPAAGHLSVLVEVFVTDGRGHRTARSATVGFRLQVPQDVVVTVRELARGSVIAAADIRRERRSGERLPRGPVAEIADAVGKEVLRAMAPGEVLTTSAVAPVRAIRRGSVVTLLLEGPGFRIAARGVASEDGAVGQTIRVVNQASRRELAGKVEDDRTVRVAF
jgi:flagella basal body P-ring formation protein FlgA